MNRFLMLSTISLLVFVGGCRKTETPPTVAPTTVSEAPTPEQYHTGQGGSVPAAAGQTKLFKGSIGGKNGLQMRLLRDGDHVSGSYFYEKVGPNSKIEVKGNVDKDGNLSLDEFDSTGKQTGGFKGIWKLGDDGRVTLAGNWSKPDGSSKTAFSLHEEPIDFASGNEVVSKQIKEVNKKLNYKIDVKYPQITNVLDNRFDKFNLEAKEIITKRVAEFKKEMANNAKEAAQATEPTATADVMNELTATYRVAMANDDLISVLYDIGGYEAGAAHGSSAAYALNYDVRGGKELNLADVFKPGKYIPTISEYCIKDLKRQSQKNGDSLPDDMIATGAGPSAENFTSWTVTKKGLEFTFDAYAVGPYAAGPQKVFIPYSVLKDLINPDGLVGKLAT